MKTYLPVKPILLCVCSLVLSLTSAAQAAKVLTGKSYVNVTKGLNGGTIEPGDILEIRATIAVGNWDGRSVSRAHYVDTIPANTTYIPGSLKILTNEGLTFKAYTDASGDDPAYYDPAGYLRINLGSTNNAGVSLGGACTSTVPWSLPYGGLIHGSGRPSFYGGVCIMSASFRIRVNPSMTYGSSIYLHGGAFYFRNNSNQVSSPCNKYTIALKQNAGLCANAIGANAVIDYGGTFGAGTVQNRALMTTLVPGFNFQNVTTGQPDDGSFSIVNNMSPSGNTNPNSPIPNATNRVFKVWDIMGDHTGATDPAAGNLPVAPGANGGYFVAVNAAYANSNAIQQTVGGLCPNTYYEFSAWFKNICRYCACDSTGDPSYETSGVPFANPNFNGPDSSGVNPNLTFTVDGVDYYTSGNLKYTGQWVKKGFVYQTGPGQTSFTITIRNNAAGGGGNDWAIDDVTLATCTPNLDLRPSPSLQVCVGQSIDMFANIRCYFPNYIHWRWEKSTDGGGTWTNTGVGGIGTPVMTAGEYEYMAPYPTFPATATVDNSRYRVRIASTLSNLDNNSCSFAATTIITVTTQSCTILVQTDIQAFSGRLVNELAQLQWTTFNEKEGTSYEIESSTDKVHFVKIGTVDGSLPGSNTYHFTDPKPLAAARYYRIRVTDGRTSKYSRIIQLTGGALEFAVRSVVNPFQDKINIELTAPENTAITISLMDNYGRVIKKTAATVYKGINTLSINSLEKVLPGAYIMQIQKNDQIITTRLIKSAQ